MYVGLTTSILNFRMIGYVPTYFDIKTVGLSFCLRCDKLTPKTVSEHKNKDKYTIREVGTFVTRCAKPYQKTKIVKFVPRFVIVNQLEMPVILTEAEVEDTEIYIEKQCSHNMEFQKISPGLLRVRLPTQEQNGRDEETLNKMRESGLPAHIQTLERRNFNNSG